MPLRRELGLIDAVALGLGAVIGAGIFVVIGIAAGVAGPGLLLGLGLAGIAATANALSTAQLAAAYPQAALCVLLRVGEARRNTMIAPNWQVQSDSTFSCKSCTDD